ncbi:hypothetical protein AB7W42_19180 [Providencia rettgeri]
MALLDTFVQVFEFDTRQADGAFNRVQRSTDDIIELMKRVSQDAKGGAKAFSGFLSEISTSLQQETDKSLSQHTEVTKKSANEAEKLASKNYQLAKSADGVAGQYGKATHSLSGFLVKIAGMAGIGLTLGGITSFLHSTAEEINLLSQSADALNLPVEDVDAFGKVITSMGGDAQGARDSLMDMSESIGEALQDRSSSKAEVFKSLKISLNDMQGDSINAMEGLYRLSDAVQGLSKEEAVFRIKEVGITDNKIVESILKGRKELEALTKKQKENGVVTKELALQAQKYKEVTGGLKTVFGSVMMSIMNAALPSLTKVLEWIQSTVKFCSENKDLIVGFFIAIGTAIAAYYIPPMLSAAAATLAATWPVLAIIAIIALLSAAFALVYDDIMNFIEGNDSMIGRLMDKYPALKAVIMALCDAYHYLNDALNDFIDWLVASVKGVIAWGDDFKAVFDSVSDDVVGIFKWLWAQIEQYLGWISDGLESIKKGWSTVKGWFGVEDAEISQTVERKINADGTIEHTIPETPKLSDEDTAKLLQGLNLHINNMSSNPLNPMTSQAISNQSSTTNENTVSIGELNINTQSTDAQGIAKEAKGELQSQLQDIGQQTNTGMKA